MINIKDAKVKEVLEMVHEETERRKLRRGGQMREDIVMENRIFSILCSDYDIGPNNVASAMNSRFGYDMTGDEVIQIFRSRRMANPSERKELLLWADSVTRLFPDAVQGKKEAFEKYEKLRKTPALRSGKRHDSQERLAAIMIYEKYPEIDLFDDSSSLFMLGNTLAKYFFYDFSDAICAVYGYPQYRDSKKKQQSKDNEKKFSHEQAVRRMEQLEIVLDRTSAMLQDLQDEFEEQLEANKVKELADFFAKLNSEKYGCILDELLVIRRGVDELRKNNFELPIEINGLLIMVKKLIQFVRDCHIEPMMKINSVKEVTAADVEFCNYEGTPFSTEGERKTVKVVSPGWVYRDKEIQISRPKVKEEESEGDAAGADE